MSLPDYLSQDGLQTFLPLHLGIRVTQALPIW